MSLKKLFSKSKSDLNQNSKNSHGSFSLSKSLEDDINKKGLFHTSWVHAGHYLQIGGNPHVTDDAGNTLLHVYPQITSLFVEKGGNVNHLNNKGYSALMMGVINKAVTPELILATNKENLTKVYPNGETILTAYLSENLCAYAKIECLNVLLEQGTNVNQPNAMGKTSMDCLATTKYNIPDFLPLMIQHGLDIDSSFIDQMPLSHYLLVNHPKLFLALDQIDISKLDKNGNSLLHNWATSCEEMKNEIFDYLSSKINLNIQNKEGETPLISALKQGKYWQKYLSHGELHFSQNTREKEVRCLIERGANVCLSDKMGNTPLHYAAINKQSELLPLLIKSGADIFALNIEGKLPVDYAEGISKEYLKLAADAEEINQYKKRYLLCKSLSMQSQNNSRTYTD